MLCKLLCSNCGCAVRACEFQILRGQIAGKIACHAGSSLREEERKLLLHGNVLSFTLQQRGITPMRLAYCLGPAPEQRLCSHTHLLLKLLAFRRPSESGDAAVAS